MARDIEYAQSESELEDIDFMAENEAEANRMRSNSGWLWMLAGVAVGVAAMYLLDPRSGSRRRVLLQGRVRDLGQRISHPLEFMKAPFEGGVEDASTHH
jgi:hypothetical protein